MNRYQSVLVVAIVFAIGCDAPDTAPDAAEGSSSRFVAINPLPTLDKSNIDLYEIGPDPFAPGVILGFRDKACNKFRSNFADFCNSDTVLSDMHFLGAEGGPACTVQPIIVAKQIDCQALCAQDDLNGECVDVQVMGGRADPNGGYILDQPVQSARCSCYAEIASGPDSPPSPPTTAPPETTPSCGHGTDTPGTALDPACGSCASRICEFDAFCCAIEWDGPCTTAAEYECTDTCEHDECSPGERLDPACSACVEDICEADPYCCNTEWDSICVDAGQSQCACGQ